MSKFKSKWFYASLGTYKKQVKVGILKTKTQEYYSSRYVDFEEYSKLLVEKYDELDAEGYDVVNVIPIAMGESESCTQSGGAYVGDVGFSITRDAIVIGKRRE